MLNRKELIKELAKQSELTQAQADKVLTAFTDIITSELTSGSDLTIRWLGKFKLSRRKSRKGVNPRTWESITIPSMSVATFSAGKLLKEAVRNS